MKVRLTEAQETALEVSGAALPWGADEEILWSAWQGRGFLEFAPGDEEALVSALIEFSNAQDGTAEDRNAAADERRHARGSALALSNLCDKIRAASRAERELRADKDWHRVR